MDSQQNFTDCFWDDVRTLEINSFKYAFQRGFFADGQGRVCILLIPKPLKDSRYLKIAGLGENIRLFLDLDYYCERNLPGALLFLNFEKVFELGLHTQNSRLLSFWSGLRGWVKTLCNNISSILAL